MSLARSSESIASFHRALPFPSLLFLKRSHTLRLEAFQSLTESLGNRETLGGRFLHFAAIARVSVGLNFSSEVGVLSYFSGL